MIRIENGKKSYDGRVIWENLNLTFSESGIYCLMGPSGQGKTTLYAAWPVWRRWMAERSMDFQTRGFPWCSRRIV